MKRFTSREALLAACLDLPAGSDDAAAAALARQDTLTKPQGSLGRLEALAVWLARWQGRAMPRLDKVEIIVFAGSHGVTARGVSAFPAEVTAQMVANFAAGGAAINQLARSAGAGLTVVPLEIERPTADFTIAPAMDAKAISLPPSRPASKRCRPMPICSASAKWASATPRRPPPSPRHCSAAPAATGSAAAPASTMPGWGARRRRSTPRSKHHGLVLADPLAALAAVGGRELAAIFGATLAARLHGIPLLLDGFVCTAAAAPLARLHGAGLAHAVAAHVSAEAGHRRLLQRLALKPLLDLGMRLGEGSGACLAVNIVRSALECHNGMASFAEAGVSEK